VLLAGTGTWVVIVGSTLDNLMETRDLVNHRGGTCHGVKVGVSVPDQRDAVVEQAKERWGRLDVIANYAGRVGLPGSVADIALTAWEHCRNACYSWARAPGHLLPGKRAIVTGGALGVGIETAWASAGAETASPPTRSTSGVSPRIAGWRSSVSSNTHAFAEQAHPAAGS
jgi:NAD(P)-dependent dehydrogenase (short-subunit alcohol dehydrogenase family)